MEKRIAIAVAAIVTVSAAPPPRTVVPPAQSNIADLQGRVAGKKQRCISAEGDMLFHTSDQAPNLLLWDDGKTLWVSDLGKSCGIEGGESVIPDTRASYYCKGDFVRVGDRISILPGRHCALGDFTPWRAAK
jgi:hypothetical protein